MLVEKTLVRAVMGYGKGLLMFCSSFNSDMLPAPQIAWAIWGRRFPEPQPWVEGTSTNTLQKIFASWSLIFWTWVWINTY